jgi:hypothetical protein
LKKHTKPELFAELNRLTAELAESQAKLAARGGRETVRTQPTFAISDPTRS